MQYTHIYCKSERQHRNHQYRQRSCISYTGCEGPCKRMRKTAK